MPEKAKQNHAREVVLTRWPHKGIVIAAVLAVVLAGSAGLTAGALMRGPDDATLANSLRSVEVTAKVETRQLALDPFQSSLQAGSTLTLPAAVAPGTAVPVVTASPKNIGDTITSGELLAAVGGQPVFALKLAVPMYRDLQMDAVGVDVQSLNQALSEIGLLGGAVTDKYTSRTRTAVKALYERAKYPAAGALGGESLPLRDILDLPDQPLTLTQKAQPNTVLEVGAPVITMETSVDQLSVRVDTLSKDLLAIEGTATVRSQSSAESRLAKIATISEFRDISNDDPAAGSNATPGNEAPVGPTEAASSPKFPGFDVGLTIDFGPDGNPWNAGSILVVQFDVAAEPSSAVPLTAIREDGNQTIVWVKRDSEFVKVPIDVRDQSDGWALIAANDELSVGDDVRVSP